MASIETSVEVDRPVRTVYNQWTQFETFPRFMEAVEEVTQVDDMHLRWRAEIAGQERVWDAEITEQTPDQRIAWKSVEGAENAGVVTFHRLDDERTKVMLQLDFEPDGIVETVGDKLGFVSRRAEGDLGRFKQFIEATSSETGAWRGDVTQDATT